MIPRNSEARLLALVNRHAARRKRRFVIRIDFAAWMFGVGPWR